MKKTILVIGATGTLGVPVAHFLKNYGYGVRIMTRDLQKAQKVFDNSFERITGDPTDPSCLEKALEGCSGVHISLPTDVELQAVEAVVKVASTDGVERISYISGATVAEENCWFPMINRKYLAEKAIRESGIRYTIFCPTWIMESLPMFVNQGRAAVLGKQPCPYHWVAVGDIARMIATSYGLAESVNRRFIVHGPEAIRMDEALKRYCAAFHPEIKEVSSMPLWLVKLLAALTNNHGLKGAGELMSYFEKVGEGSNIPELDGVLGAPTNTLDAWLQDKRANASHSL